MADISQEINDFKNAIYGEEVRGSMISLAEKINTEVEENTTNVNQAVSTANSASSAANQAVADANTTLQAANQAVTLAEGSASAAAGSASAAAGHAEDAEESATAAAGSASAAAQSAADAAEVAEGLGGFNGSASSVTAQDVEGLLGTPGAQSNVQALIDAIAEQVLNQLVKKSQIINNLLATQAGNVLDATQGKALKDLIDQLNSDLSISHINPEQLTQDYYNVSSIVCRVRAGWCFVSMDVTVLKVYTTHPGIDLLTGLPNPSFNIASQPFVEWSSTTNNLPLRTYIRTKDGIGVVSFRNGTVGKTHPLFFSYPIA